MMYGCVCITILMGFFFTSKSLQELSDLSSSSALCISLKQKLIITKPVNIST